MKKIIGVYGAGGLGRVVMPVLWRQTDIQSTDLVFIDDELSNEFVNDVPVLNFEEFNDLKCDTKEVVIAIADFSIRKKLFDMLDYFGINHKSVVSDTCLKLDEVLIGDNSILCPFVTLASNLVIGKSFHAHVYSYVGHDCEIGDFVTFAPGVKCNGYVRIESNVCIGTGAIINQGCKDKPLIIGEGSIIQMGAVISEDVPPGAVVYGRASSKFAERESGWL